MAKLYQLSDLNEHPTAPDFMFYCPGCKCSHGVWVTRANPTTGARWGFNGDLNNPTFSPSLLLEGEKAPNVRPLRCHSYVTDGKIHFLDDCTHELAGKSVYLPDVT